MQWLIDIILELVQPMLAALKVTIHGQLGYFDRGDPGSPDFTLVNLVQDNAWHDMDLSSIVPADARGVLLRVSFNAPSIAKQIAFRKKGHTHYPNVAYCLLNVANVITADDKIVSLDINREIQYRLSVAPITFVSITVSAWWLR